MHAPEQAVRRDLNRIARDLVAGLRTPREVARSRYFVETWMNQDESNFATRCCYFDDMINYIPTDRVPDAEAALIEVARALVTSDI